MIELGPFDLQAPLGQGGMGEVWTGLHRLQRRKVAVKLMTLEAARNPVFRAAFRNEVRAAAALDHPNLVMVYEYGEATEATERGCDGRIRAGTPFLAMELVEGGTLHTLKGRLDWPRLRTAIVALLDALAHAHARGVIHRDLKPGNVLAGAREDLSELKLTDFGLAHAVEGAMASDERPFYGGTPSYMAPEQFGGRWRDYGPWTDLYAFGCLVYALVRGQPPFGATKSYQDKQRQHLTEAVPPLNPTFPVPVGFESWLRRLLEKEPGRRFRRAADAAHAFHELGPPDVGQATHAPAPTEDVDTVVLGSLTTFPRERGDVTTLALPPEAMDGTALTLASRTASAPPLPSDWRRPGEDQRDRLTGAGLGLFGLRTPPLVGREEERDRLWAALADVRRDKHARLVVLSGAVGCGKSRIAEWLCERAHEVGAALVLRASHGPVAGAGHGLGPMVSGFLRCQGLTRSEVLARVEQIFRTHGVDYEDEWMALTEVIAPAVGPEPGAIRFGSAIERYVTIRRLVQALCVERPVVLWLDDAHWGLDALRFVAYVLERQRRHPIPLMVVATVSDEILLQRRDEAALLAELLERDDAARIEVGPLPSEPFRELAEELLGLDPALAGRVERRSGGSPLFAVQLVGDWVAGGLLEVGARGFQLGAETELPDDVAALWRGRVARVLAKRSPAEVRALELAAVLGMEVDADEWLAACDRSGYGSQGRRPVAADPSEPLLDALLSQRLARAGAGGPARGWSFAHAMLRESLERWAAARGELADLHGICAEVLADRVAMRGPDAPAGLVERLGRHLIAADQVEEALQPLLEAARSRDALGDYAASESVLDLRDHGLTAAGVPPSDPRWGEGWLVRHDVARGRGAYEEADALLARIEQTSARYAWTAVSAHARCYRGRQARIAGDLGQALAALTDVERLASRLGDLALRARARWEMGSTLTDHGDLEQGERYARQALADFEAAGDPVGCAQAWQSLGELTKEAGRHTEAAVLLRQAEALFEECGSRWGMASAINSQGDVARYQGDLDEADALYRRARGLFRAIGSGAWSFPDFNLGLIELTRGHVQSARATLERNMATFVRQGNRSAIAGAHLALAVCAAREARWLEWDEHIREARALVRNTATVDEDTARTASLAGTTAEAAGELHRAVSAWRLARSQWLGLRRTPEIADADAVLDRLERRLRR